MSPQFVDRILGILFMINAICLIVTIRKDCRVFSKESNVQSKYDGRIISIVVAVFCIVGGIMLISVSFM